MLTAAEYFTLDTLLRQAVASPDAKERDAVARRIYNDLAMTPDRSSEHPHPTYAELRVHVANLQETLETTVNRLRTERTRADDLDESNKVLHNQLATAQDRARTLEIELDAARVCNRELIEQHRLFGEALAAANNALKQPV